MKLREAAEQALKYFEDAHGLEDTEVAIKEALREALAQQRSFSEDVGRLLSTGKGFYDDGTPIDPKEINMKIEGVGDGVVTCTEVHLPRPPKKEWVGLTDEEIHEVVSKKWWDWEDAFDIEGFSRAIEAKLKKKNTSKGCA